MHQGCFQTESTSCEPWDEGETPLGPGPPHFCNSKCPVFGFAQSRGTCSSLGSEQGRGIPGTRGAHLCRKGHCAMGVAWSICLSQPLCWTSSCCRPPEVHLRWGNGLSRAAPTPGNAPGQFGEARVESKCRTARWQKGSGAKGQGPVRLLLSIRMLDEGKGDSFRLTCVPQEKRTRSESWHFRHTRDPGKPSSWSQTLTWTVL